MVAQPASPSANKRYDRQVRIWGPHGQVRLEAARVCVLGAGPTASETLKNLVLGGIASFTIVDSEQVAQSDLANNFFCCTEDLGKGRAEATTNLIRDLNESVQGTYLDARLEDLVDSQPGFFEQFTLVIATQVRESLAIKVDEICRSFGIMMVSVRSYGPFGTLRVSRPELCIIESRRENTPADLRLTRPWQELMEFADSFDFDTCDDITHGHIPYAALLLRCMNRWRSEHGGPPADAQQRRAFKELIQGMQRSVDGVPLEEQNWQEAMRAANTAWVQPTIPQEVQAILDDPATSLQPSSSPFWVMAAALKMFVEGEGEGSLPLEGSIPDMWSTTDLYLKLQRIYRAKADEQCAAVHAHARELLKRLSSPAADVTADDVKQFCKNAYNLRVVRFRSIKDECGSPSNVEGLKENMLPESSDEASLYILLRAADQFYEQHGRMPGETAEAADSAWEDDIQRLRQIATHVIGDMGLQASSIRDELVMEVCRCAGAEVHCTAAVMGGMAAQESIKVIMQQFVPIGGTLVYNGIGSRTATFKL